MQLLGLYRELCPGHTELESMRDHLDAGEYPEKNTLIDYLLHNGENAIACDTALTDVLDGQNKIYGYVRADDGSMSG